MGIGSRSPLVLTAVAAFALAPVSCRPSPLAPASSTPPSSAARTLGVDDLLSRPAEMFVTLHPPAIERDRIYGPLLRRASSMAAAYAGPRTMGTTALAALERTDEVVVALNDAGKEAVVVLRGVPADLDASSVVDERASPIWRPVVGDVGRSVVEYEPVASADAALFVIPPRTWIIATGDAKARTREALTVPVSPASFAGEDAPLAILSFDGPALVRRDARLRDGPIAPLGRTLTRASLELAPGVEGVIDARLVYADAAAAAEAETTAREIVTAFGKGLSSKAPPALAWLGASGVSRKVATVTVRTPLPKPWLAALAKADVATPEDKTAPKGANGAAPHPDDVPWQLWHHPAPGASSSAPTPLSPLPLPSLP